MGGKRGVGAFGELCVPLEKSLLCPCGNESNNEESSADIENQEEEEVNSENGVEAEGTQESDNDTENDSQETKSSSPETSTTFHSKSLCEHCENSNVYGTLIKKCPKCFWHDYYKICP